MLKANVGDGHVRLMFIPDNLDDILSNKKDTNDAIALFLAGVMSDVSAVVSGVKNFLEDNIGTSTATMFKDLVCEHPEALFGEIKKVMDEVEKMKEEIRNADFD